MGIFYIKFTLGALSRMHMCMGIYILDVIKEMSTDGGGGAQFPVASSQILATINKTSTPTFCLNHPSEKTKLKEEAALQRIISSLSRCGGKNGLRHLKGAKYLTQIYI